MIIRVLDLETQNHPYYGNVASVHHPENYVVELGWQDFAMDGTDLTEVKSRRYESKEEANAAHEFNLDGVSWLVVHNAQYELSWYLKRYPQYFLPWYRAGGRVLCTAYAEYLISHQIEKYPSLNETAVKHGGTHKVDGVKVLWESGILTADIDPELLHEYLTGPNGDIENTSRCFFSQKKMLKDMGVWSMYLVRCDALVSYAMCEVAGMYVNKDIAQRHMESIKLEIEQLHKELQVLLPADFPKECEFNWSSMNHRSALLYGGPIEYKAKVSYEPKQYEKIDAYQTIAGDFIDVEKGVPNNPVVYKNGKNKGLPKVFKINSTTEKLKWSNKLYFFKGLVDISKLPAVVQESYQQQWTSKRTLADKVTPLRSTKEEVLKVLQVQGVSHTYSLYRLAALQKDLGTYYLNEIYNSQGEVVKRKGCLQFVNPEGIIHPSINATATVTGRLSMSNPSLQTLPRGDLDAEGQSKSKVKEIFTSRFGDEGRIIQVDYSGLEVVVQAGSSKDPVLLGMLAQGVDLHIKRLAYDLNRPYEEVYEICNNPKHELNQKYKQLRSATKQLGFAAQYWSSAQGLVYNNGVSLEFAERFLKLEAELFPRTAEYRYEMLAEVEKNAEGNYEREFRDGQWVVYKRGYYKSPSGIHYSFRQYPRYNFETRKKEMAFKKTEIANYKLQGGGAEVMSVAMALLGRWLIKNDYFRNEEYPQGRVFLINNVHDAAYVDAHVDLALNTARMVKKIMEYAPVYMSKHLGYDYAELNLKFPAVAEVGKDMTHGEVIN